MFPFMAPNDYKIVAIVLLAIILVVIRIVRVKRSEIIDFNDKFLTTKSGKVYNWKDLISVKFLSSKTNRSPELFYGMLLTFKSGKARMFQKSKNFKKFYEFANFVKNQPAKMININENQIKHIKLFSKEGKFVHVKYYY